MFLYVSFIPVSDAGLHGVYEGSCGNYDMKATLREPNKGEVSGYIEVTPKPSNIPGTCGAFTINGGMVANKRTGKRSLNIESGSWIYYSGIDASKKINREKGEIKLSGSFMVDYNGEVKDSFGLIEGCNDFSLERISYDKSPPLKLPNKDKCENGMFANPAPGNTENNTSTASNNDNDSFEGETKHNIHGVELNMSHTEAKFILNKLKKNGYRIEDIKSKDAGISYVHSMIAVKDVTSRVNVLFYGPPHDNVVSSITKTFTFNSAKNPNSPHPEEVTKALLRKYGEPKEVYEIAQLAQMRYSYYSYSETECAAIHTPNKSTIFKFENKDTCGPMFGFSVGQSYYHVQLTDITGMLKKRIERQNFYHQKHMRDMKEKEKEKIRRIENSTYKLDL